MVKNVLLDGLVAYIIFIGIVVLVILSPSILFEIHEALKIHRKQRGK